MSKEMSDHCSHEKEIAAMPHVGKLSISRFVDLFIKSVNPGLWPKMAIDPT